MKEFTSKSIFTDLKYLSQQPIKCGASYRLAVVCINIALNVSNIIRSQLFDPNVCTVT